MDGNVRCQFPSSQANKRYHAMVDAPAMWQLMQLMMALHVMYFCRLGGHMLKQPVPGRNRIYRAPAVDHQPAGLPAAQCVGVP